jgi:hypothetical protein
MVNNLGKSVFIFNLPYNMERDENDMPKIEESINCIFYIDIGSGITIQVYYLENSVSYTVIGGGLVSHSFSSIEEAIEYIKEILRLGDVWQSYFDKLSETTKGLEKKYKKQDHGLSGLGN